MKRPLFQRFSRDIPAKQFRKKTPTKFQKNNIHKIIWKIPKSKDISPEKLWRTISTKRTLKTSPQENEKKNVYQTNLWKTCSTKNPWEKTSTKIASEKQICTQEISTPKKLKEHLQRISVQKPSLKKRDILHPKKSRWISITKKKKLHLKIQKNVPKKIWTGNCLPEKLWRIPSKKYLQRNLYQRIFEETSPPKLYSISEDKFIPKRIETKSYQKISDVFFAKKVMQRNLCNFPSREISTKQNWRDICTSKSVKRNLYQKMSEETFLPKSLKRHLQQRIWEEKSLAKNLSRKKSTKSLKILSNWKWYTNNWEVVYKIVSNIWGCSRIDQSPQQ